MESSGNNQKPYLITFKPINRFFFGSSYSLGEGFYAKSLKFPQPTTVLGCVRNTILAQKNLIHITDIPKVFLDDAKMLTGKSVISYLSDDEDDFGVVERISPVFLVKQSENKIQDALFRVPADVIMNECSYLACVGYEKTKKDIAISSYSGRVTNCAILSGKQPKAVNPDYFGDKFFWNAYLNKKPLPYNLEHQENKIFTVHTSVGIRRENRIVEKNAFYYKIDYSLKDGFSFGVIVWEKDGDEYLKDGIVILGGEQSTFLMEISPISDDLLKNPVIRMILNGECSLMDILSSCSGKEKIVALSPIVLNETSSTALANVMEHKVVHGMQSMRTVKRANGKNKSEATRMIPAGSVFYPLKDVEIGYSWKIPYKIGYNYALKIERR